MRFLTPVLFGAAAGWVYWYNAQHAGQAVVFPFVELLDPSAAGNPARQGELTVLLLGGMAVVLALWEGVRWARERAEST